MTGKGRTATVMGSYPVFVLPSLLHSFPHSSLLSFSCRQPLLLFPCFDSSPPLLLSSSLHYSVLPSSCSTPYIALPVSLIHFTPCCPACSQPCLLFTNTRSIFTWVFPLNPCCHLSSVHLLPYTNIHKDRSVQTSAYWHWSHFQ